MEDLEVTFDVESLLLKGILYFDNLDIGVW